MKVDRKKKYTKTNISTYIEKKKKEEQSKQRNVYLTGTNEE
jgi:hypothetical protein